MENDAGGHTLLERGMRELDKFRLRQRRLGGSIVSVRLECGSSASTGLESRVMAAPGWEHDATPGGQTRLQNPEDSCRLTVSRPKKTESSEFWNSVPLGRD